MRRFESCRGRLKLWPFWDRSTPHEWAGPSLGPAHSVTIAHEHFGRYDVAPRVWQTEDGKLRALAGSGRVRAAKKAKERNGGLSEVPVIVLEPPKIVPRRSSCSSPKMLFATSWAQLTMGADSRCWPKKA